MAYLRWSFSDWYVYASVGGGLSITPRESLVDDDHGEYQDGFRDSEVRDLLSGQRLMQTIPGWRRASTESKRELLWALREYLADENGENLYEPFHNMRQMMRGVERPEDDKDHDIHKAQGE